MSSSVKVRVDRLIEEYMDVYNGNGDAIIGSIESLRRRLGNKKTDGLIADFKAEKIRAVVETLLVEYYDPMYGYERADKADYDLAVDADEVEEATEMIIQYLQQFGR